MARLVTVQLMILALAGCDGSTAESNDVAAPGATANAAAPTRNQAAAAPANINLDDAMQFVEANQCRAGPELRRALDRMLIYDEATNTRRVGGVTLAGLEGPMVPLLEINPSTQEGLRMVEYKSTLDLPPGARWHGLRLRRLVVTHLDVDESDDQDQTDFVFAETPATVRRVLGEHGFDVPLAPAYRELEDGACGGAMAIEAVPGGAALQCGYGC